MIVVLDIDDNICIYQNDKILFSKKMDKEVSVIN